MDDPTRTADAAGHAVQALGGLPEPVALTLIVVIGAVATAWLWTTRRKDGVSSDMVRLMVSAMEEQARSVQALAGNLSDVSTAVLDLSRQTEALMAQNQAMLEQLSSRGCMAGDQR